MTLVNSRLRENPVLQKMPRTEREWVQYQNELAKWVRQIVKLGDGSITTADGTTISGLDQMPGTLPSGDSIPTASAFNSTSLQDAAPLSGTDAGATATISIASHSIVYDGGTVAYNSGSITGLAFSTQYWIYADDPSKAGGAVTYVATTTKTDVTSDSGYYYVGSCTTPANGAGDTIGLPGGGGGSYEP